MSNATTPASSRLRDPLLTRSVKKLQGPVGHKLNKRYACLSLIVGVLDGLAVSRSCHLQRHSMGIRQSHHGCGRFWQLRS